MVPDFSYLCPLLFLANGRRADGMRLSALIPRKRRYRMSLRLILTRVYGTINYLTGGTLLATS